MSWYKVAKERKEATEKMVKSASRRFVFDQDSSRFQDEWSFDFGDYQRWVVDAFNIEAYMTKLSDKCIISLHVYNWHNGSMRYQEFWKYGSDEEDRCKETFKKVINACKEVIEEATLPENEPQPKSVVTPKLRAKVWQIDRERLPKTNIPSVNYYYEKASPVEDWRSSIYGNRYPDNPSSGY